MTQPSIDYDNGPLVRVGILSAPEIDVNFNQEYINGCQSFTGHFHFSNNNLVDGDHLFSPISENNSFSIENVVIGKDFHWQRKQCQTFHGSILLRVRQNRILAINIIPAEQYLESVISSEMSAQASSEFLKAHAVISRSWLMARIQKNVPLPPDNGMTESESERIRWYDNSGHTEFDVCADDHCQRYQGISGINGNARAAVRETRGEILMDGDKICDTRFSKCCGGASETFENCWQSIPKRYLRPGRDLVPHLPVTNLSSEQNAVKWILTQPASFCNTTDETILRQVLRDYDQATRDFFRWKVEYSQKELADIIRERSGIDFGDITDLLPVERGASARIVKLRIVGTLRSMTIGKELEIRRILSPTHLYSSAFVVEKGNIDSKGTPGRFIFHGAGWGHGVGLCQIGAAVMAAKGFSYRQILAHYYPGSVIHRFQDTTSYHE